MKNTFNSSMFDSIKTAMETAKSKSGGPAFKNILAIEAPGTYTVRLLPNIKTPAETFAHYYHHGWKSVNTGRFGSVVSPSSWGDRCPISDLYFKILRDGTEEEKAFAAANMRRKESWLVNVLVVNDPKNPENNGTIKVLRYGRQLNKIIESAISGDDAEEFGSKIFDLSERGCNLRIKAEMVSEKPGATKYPTYTASKFLNPSAIENLTDEKIEELYNGIFDLNTFIEHKTAAEIEEFIKTHYTVNGTSTSNTPAKSSKPAAKVDDEDEPEDVPYTPAKTSKPAAESATTNVANDAKVKNILEGLEDL